jgi:ribosomal-protein-alanine acetyltransferase
LVLEHFQIRKANNSDLEKICAVEEVSFSYDPYPSFLIEKLIQDRQSMFLVLIESDGNLSGYCVAKVEDQRAHLISLAVVPSHRRSGVATVLVKALFSALVDRNVHEVTLEVRTDNDAAIRLYSRLGFARESTVERYYSNGSDGLRMKKRL